MNLESLKEVPTPIIILKGREVDDLIACIDEIPHGHAKKLIHIINMAQLNRKAEPPKTLARKALYPTEPGPNEAKEKAIAHEASDSDDMM